LVAAVFEGVSPTNPHWVVGYGPFSLCVIHKEGLCPSSGDINRLMMMVLRMLFPLTCTLFIRHADFLHIMALNPSVWYFANIPNAPQKCCDADSKVSVKDMEKINKK
jgi:hypothetical protein